jgi:hypothetical protein
MSATTDRPRIGGGNELVGIEYMAPAGEASFDAAEALDQTPVFELGSLVMDPALSGASTLFHTPVTFGTQWVDRDAALALLFNQSVRRQTWIEAEADALEQETAHLSAIRRATKNPRFELLAYEGSNATTVALERLTGESRPLWLLFLQRTEGSVAHGADTIDEAAGTWRSWGRKLGLL